MKKMKTTIAVALAACVSTSLIAQTLTKMDTITINLVGAKQLSVSTSPVINNNGNWSQGPMYYKTTPVKVTDKDIIKYIGAVMYKNAGYYSAKATLKLVQGELSGFFNITPDLGLSHPDLDGNALDPWFSEFPGYTADSDASTLLANSFDSTTFQLANGRHWAVNPLDERMYPVGHLQPWGQIFVQDPVKGICDNVTFFFALSVEECYDCFYLNSFISTATFKSVSSAPNGPPCCSGSTVIVGTGKDAYYLTFSFDNTENNPYLAHIEGNSLWFGDEIGIARLTGGAQVVEGLASDLIVGDGIVPDTIYDHNYNNPQIPGYIDPIRSGLGKPSPYEARFTLNGVLTYTWKLGYVDKTDLSPDFVGVGNYVANGYGFIGLYCTLFNSAAITFAEKAAKITDCCNDVNWYDNWYGVGAEYEDYVSNDVDYGWITLYDAWFRIESQPAYGTGVYPWGSASLFGWYPTPINVSTSLTYHENFNNQYPSHRYNNGALSAWQTPAWIASQYW